MRGWQPGVSRLVRLASRLQKSLLPSSQISLPGAQFATRVLPASSVSGDFFDIFRLDEHHIGFYVADARGHGIPAALLTVYVKKALWTKEIEGHSYRIVSPAQTLAQLNTDLLADRLSDSHFITMCYAIYNVQTRDLVWCNGGHPPTLVVDEAGDITPLEAGFGVEMAIAAARLDRTKANGLVVRLLEKYESQIGTPPSGSTYQECYDVTTGKPGEAYLRLYDEVKAELGDMGVPFE